MGTTAEVWVPGAYGPVDVGPGEHTIQGSITPVVRSRETIRDVVADPELWRRVVGP